jgi:hypothetical protein
MQFPIDRSGLVSLFGLLSQCSIAWLFAVLFPLLARPAGRPLFFRIWTLALFGLALGLSALSLRYLLPPMFANLPAFADGEPVPQLLYIVYQCGKLLFAGALLDGALCLRLGELSTRGRLMLWGPLVAVGIESFFLGCIARMLYDYSGRARRRWTRAFSYTRTVLASAGPGPGTHPGVLPPSGAVRYGIVPQV